MPIGVLHLLNEIVRGLTAGVCAHLASQVQTVSDLNTLAEQICVGSISIQRLLRGFLNRHVLVSRFLLVVERGVWCQRCMKKRCMKKRCMKKRCMK